MCLNRHLQIPILLVFALPAAVAWGQGDFVIPTNLGEVTVPLAHAGPRGEILSPSLPEATPFRPVTIFSAPLPSGSAVSSQSLRTDVRSDLAFDQRGIIYAVSPAFAAEVSPSLSFGVAVNLFYDSPLSSQRIRSRTLTTYAGRTESTTRTTTRRNTVATFQGEGGGFLSWRSRG